MTYLKLISEKAKRHLVVPAQDPGGFDTLCGCTITRAGNWRVITALEGDECEKMRGFVFFTEAARQVAGVGRLRFRATDPVRCVTIVKVVAAGRPSKAQRAAGTPRKFFYAKVEDPQGCVQ